MARLVYTSGPGGESGSRSAPCARCGKTRCDCSGVAARPPAAHALRVRRERAGRKGKTVTVVSPLFVERDQARALLTELKRGCGSGGAMKESTAPDGSACFALELQGDHVAAVTEGLTRRGYPTKQAGG